MLGLAATQLGAIVGFPEGIAIAFFIAPILWVTGAMGSDFVKSNSQFPLYSPYSSRA